MDIFIKNYEQLQKYIVEILIGIREIIINARKNFAGYMHMFPNEFSYLHFFSYSCYVINSAFESKLTIKNSIPDFIFISWEFC